MLDHKTRRERARVIIMSIAERQASSVGKRKSDRAKDQDYLAAMRMAEERERRAKRRKPNRTYHIAAFKPPPELVIARDRRASHIPTLTALICGDPKPGQSALDQKRQAQLQRFFA